MINHTLPVYGIHENAMPKIRLLDSVRNAIRVRQYSLSTEKVYIAWIRRFILFHGKRHPRVVKIASRYCLRTWLISSQHIWDTLKPCMIGTCSWEWVKHNCPLQLVENSENQAAVSAGSISSPASIFLKTQGINQKAFVGMFIRQLSGRQYHLHLVRPA